MSSGGRKSSTQKDARKAEEAFIRGLIDRGEAAKADEHGNLPPGATHEIIGVSESGLPIVIRRRFYTKK
jgi:hypothetical protein